MTSQNKQQSKEVTLGSMLKQARVERGLTIAKLSQEAGIAVGQVHKLENDQVKKVNPAHLAALAGPLGVPWVRLYTAAGYQVSELQDQEEALVKRLRQLSPEALNSVTRLLDEYLATDQMSWETPLLARVEAEYPERDGAETDTSK